MIHADTNFLMACYFQVPGRSEAVGRFMLQYEQPVVAAGCMLFALFDTRSRARALALALRLKVFPEATVEYKAGLAILRA